MGIILIFEIMRRLILLFSCCILLFSCEFQQETLWTGRYRIVEHSGHTPSYKVTYKLPNGSTKIFGPITDNFWETDDLEGYKDGDLLSIKLELISGQGDFELTILVNGSSYESDRVTLDQGSTEISRYIEEND